MPQPDFTIELQAALAEAWPMRDETVKGRRELALGAVGLGAALLAGLPAALALAGASWQGGVRVKRRESATRLACRFAEDAAS